MAAAVLGLIFLVFFAAMIAGLVFWILKIVEVAGIPEPQYRAAGTDKTVWVLVVVLVGWVGALIWQFAKREDVLRARGLVPPGGAPGPMGQPPGWYPEFGTGWFAYWDGFRWTGARQPPQPIQYQQPQYQQPQYQQQYQYQHQQPQPTAALPGADPHGQQGWEQQQGRQTGPGTRPSLEKHPD